MWVVISRICVCTLVVVVCCMLVVAECDSPTGLKSCHMFIREPPDGCDKVKIIEESRSVQGHSATVANRNYKTGSYIYIYILDSVM